MHLGLDPFVRFGQDEAEGRFVGLCKIVLIQRIGHAVTPKDDKHTELKINEDKKGEPGANKPTDTPVPGKIHGGYTGDSKPPAKPPEQPKKK